MVWDDIVCVSEKNKQVVLACELMSKLSNKNKITINQRNLNNEDIIEERKMTEYQKLTSNTRS